MEKSFFVDYNDNTNVNVTYQISSKLTNLFNIYAYINKLKHKVTIIFIKILETDIIALLCRYFFSNSVTKNIRHTGRYNIYLFMIY